jgi:hypothetical protein
MKVLSYIGILLVVLAFASLTFTPQTTDASQKLIGAGTRMCGQNCRNSYVTDCPVYCSGGPRDGCEGKLGDGICIGDDQPCYGSAQCDAISDRYCVL